MSTQTNTKKLNIIAVGGVSKILANFPKNQNLFALDTNSKNLNSLPDHIQKIQFGGDGSGGDPEFAASLFDPKLVDQIFDCDLLILIAGLGGGTGSGITPLLAKIAKEKGVLTKIIAFTPRTSDGIKTKNKADQILENLKDFGFSITLIDNQAIFEKMSPETNSKDFWKIADFGANECINSIESILETSNIDFNDLKSTLNYGGFCYTNTSCGTDFESAYENLNSTITISKEQFKTAKGFLLNFRIGKSGMTIEQEKRIQNFIQLHSQAELKTNQLETGKEECEITILISGIGTQTKIDENYSKIIQEKAENEQKKYLSQIRSDAGKQNLSKK